MNETTDTSVTKAAPWKYKIKYSYVVAQSYFHLAAAYGIYLALTSAKWKTWLFTYAMMWINSLGTYAGAHRLFSHKSYKATMPLQVFLMLCQSSAYQRSIATWVLDHRLHHKYSDTDGDPHNSSRGMFFAHIGWIFCKKHPEAVKRAKSIDMSDVYSNSVIMYQKKHEQWLLPLFAFVLPTLIPVVFWDETFNNSWHVNMARYVYSLNSLFLVNSIAHNWGYRRYDKTIRPTGNNIVSIFSFGEGFHNFHHVFPQDYRAGEFGGFLNFTALFIDLCAFFGLAYSLKTVSNDMIETRKQRTGDGHKLLFR